MKKRSFLRATDLLNLAYVAFIGLLILIFHKNQARWSYYFSLHAAGIVLLYFFYRASAGTRREGIRFLRDILMPILLIFYYEETESLNHMVTGEFLDPFFAGIEEAIFGCQPAFEFVKVMPQAWFSEYMHFSYFSYYLLIPWLALPLWFKRRRREYDELMFSCLLCMAFCYTFFIFVPCAGPWHYYEHLSMRWNFPGYMEMVLKYGEIANGAFPSSHCAMATVILLCAWRFHRRIFWFMLPVVLGLYASTVYTQAHYVIDIPAGILTGAFFYWAARPVKRWMERTLSLRVSDLESIQKR